MWNKYPRWYNINLKILLFCDINKLKYDIIKLVVL